MGTPNEYLQYLPAALQVDEATGIFLRGFHRILTGPQGEEPQGEPLGIEQLLDNIHTYFLPVADRSTDLRALPEFLPWLASWVATSLREDWSQDTKRQFIQKVSALYPRRGTLDCIRQLLTFFLGPGHDPVIQDDSDRPYHFLVRLRIKGNSEEEVSRCERIARAIIDREKPAHTDYDLIIESPAMQIIDLPAAGGILLGKNTLLGIETNAATQ